MIRGEIKNLIEKAIKELQKEKVFPAFNIPEIEISHPENKDYGDYSTNIAFQLAKIAKKSPLEAGDLICKKIDKFQASGLAGFINFHIPAEYLQEQIGEILKQKENFGNSKIGKGQKLNIEFISANPTGPLHIGNARGGYCGDVLANILNKAGFRAEREYYVNDRGRQIKFLQDTLNGNLVYKNEYTDELLKKGEKDVKKTVEFIVGKIKKTTERMGINFDRWFYETKLHDKETRKVIEFLKKKKLIYEKEGALWFKSSQFGDDKDRVLIRAAQKTTYEQETYLLSDIAYLKNKFERGFQYLIIFLGAEHHGYVSRLKAAVEALGYDKKQFIPIVFQLVRLIKEGKEVRMSKRAGIYVAMDDLLDELGNGDDAKARDISRFFFLSKTAGTHLDFDMDLAKEHSEKNPVYYVQYAHARINSILGKIRNSNIEIRNKTENLKLLNHKSELNLIKQLIRLPEVIKDTAKDYQVQRLPQYATDLATAFHAFYRDCRILCSPDEAGAKEGQVSEGLSQARLVLISATQIVLQNTLSLMGISAPDKM